MIKKSIVAIVVMLAAAALVFGASGNHTNSTNTSNQGQSSVTGSSSSSDSASDDKTSNNTTKTKITSTEAKKIAQKYIEVQGATAGTPKLIKTNGQYIYAVPVIDNGTNVGEIDINAITGKNVGGAGGVSQ